MVTLLARDRVGTLSSFLAAALLCLFTILLLYFKGISMLGV